MLRTRGEPPYPGSESALFHHPSPPRLLSPQYHEHLASSTPTCTRRQGQLKSPRSQDMESPGSVVLCPWLSHTRDEGEDGASSFSPWSHHWINSALGCFRSTHTQSSFSPAQWCLRGQAVPLAYSWARDLLTRENPQVLEHIYYNKQHCGHPGSSLTASCFSLVGREGEPSASQDGSAIPTLCSG